MLRSISPSLRARDAVTSTPRERVCSLDHLVGKREQPVGHLEPKRLGCLEVEHELELGGLHDRQVSRVMARRMESSTLHKPANFFPPVPLSLGMGTMMGFYECATPSEPSFCCWRRRYPLARWHLPTTVGFLAAFFVTATANSAAATATVSWCRRTRSA